MSAPEPIAGGVCAVPGFTASAAAAGIKHAGSDRLDCALFHTTPAANIAGVFTTNRVRAASVQWTHGVCVRGTARAVFFNSGNANAATGAQGIEDVQAIAEQVSLGLDIPITEVAVGQTGVIGVPVPMDRLQRGLAACLEGLGPDDEAAARAMMTTDTVPKRAACRVQLSHGPVTVGGVAKGSGMIQPNMATMLCLVATDATAELPVLQAMVRAAADDSFHCIAVDNDLSTNDTLLLLANGAAAQAPVLSDTEDYARLLAGVRHVCVDLAQQIVRDGEGATKFVEIEVEGAASDEDARRAARAIALSQLCKTAFFGEDPNWGRFISAAGYSGAVFEPRDLSLWLGGLQLMEAGLPLDYAEADAQAAMRDTDLHLRLALGDGPGRATFWTSDLSYDYVRINAEYRT